MEKERNKVRKSYTRVNTGSQLCIWRDSDVKIMPECRQCISDSRAGGAVRPEWQGQKGEKVNAGR